MLISFLFYRLPFGLRQRLEPRCRVKSANEHEKRSVARLYAGRKRVITTANLSSTSDVIVSLLYAGKI
jgi:hypothetical protein